MIFENITNKVDVDIVVNVVTTIDELAYEHKITLEPGESKTITHTYPPYALFLELGEHTLEICLKVKLSGQSDEEFETYFSIKTKYTVVGRAEGDITKVEVDSKLLPEGDTLEWTKNLQATITVYFKNVGDAAGKFTIKTVDEGGTTLCSVETSEIPADGKEYSVECGSFTPTEAKKKTLTVTIEP